MIADAVAAAAQVDVAEIGSVGDAKIAERGGGRRGDLRRELEPLPQMNLYERNVDPAAYGHRGQQMERHGRLGVDGGDAALVAEESACEVVGPFGREAVRGEEAQAHDGPPAAQRAHIIEVGDRVDGVGEAGGETGSVVGEAALRDDQRPPDAHLLPLGRRDSGGIEEDAGSVAAGRCDAGAGTAHGAGALLVHPVPLGGGRAGDPEPRQHHAGGQHCRKPSHRLRSHPELRRGAPRRGSFYCRASNCCASDAVSGTRTVSPPSSAISKA